MRALSEKERERESVDESVAQESAGLQYAGGPSDCLLPSGEGRKGEEEEALTAAVL